LGFARFWSLVRGVSNHGAAPSFETGATLCLCVAEAHALARRRMRWRPPLDEADKILSACHALVHIQWNLL
jgi:hypothetical protein